MIKIQRLGRSYTEGQVCPACSSERDKGGRLVAKKRKLWYLKCDKCRYTLKREKSMIKQERAFRKFRDRSLFRRKKIIS